MTDPTDRVETFKKRLASHPWIAPLLIVGLIVGAVAGFADNVASLWQRLTGKPAVEVIWRRLRGDSLLPTAPRAAADSFTSMPPLTGYPTLDVVVANSSPQPLVLTELHIHTRQISFLPDIGYMCWLGPLRPEWQYNILADNSAPYSDKATPLLYSVAPNSAERFLIRIGHGPQTGVGTYHLVLTARTANAGSLPLLDTTLTLRSSRCQPTGPLPGITHLPAQP